MRGRIGAKYSRGSLEHILRGRTGEAEMITHRQRMEDSMLAEAMHKAGHRPSTVRVPSNINAGLDAEQAKAPRLRRVA